jgi:hypothetical protein
VVLRAEDHAEAEVAVRHERAQRTRLGERGAIAAVGAHGITSVRMPRDVAEQVLGVAHERRMARYSKGRTKRRTAALATPAPGG